MTDRMSLSRSLWAGVLSECRYNQSTFGIRCALWVLWASSDCGSFLCLQTTKKRNIACHKFIFYFLKCATICLSQTNYARYLCEMSTSLGRSVQVTAGNANIQKKHCWDFKYDAIILIHLRTSIVNRLHQCNTYELMF